MFKKAERKQVKLKIAMTGPTGSGKTWSALRLATGLGGKIAFIDTENKSASLYAEFFDFDVLDLNPPFTTEKYVEAINFAEKAGYASIVIDSLTHAWAGEGGLLEQKALLDSRPGSNQWTNWGPIDKKDQALKNSFLHSSCHIIATMRSKMEYSQTEDNGKKKVQKLGLAPIQRDGLAYEFSVVFDIAMDHNAEVSKDRTHLFDSDKIFKVSEDTGKLLDNWLKSGKELVPEVKNESDFADKQAAKVAKKHDLPVAPKESTKIAPPPKVEKVDKDLGLLPNPADYVYTFGKFKGKKISEMPIEDVDKNIVYWEKKASDDRKMLDGDARDFVNNGNAFLIAKGYYPPPIKQETIT